MLNLLIGNNLDLMKSNIADNSIDCVICSPSYYKLRRNQFEITWPDGWKGELGQEKNVSEYIQHLKLIFQEVYRVLDDTGNLFVVIADSSNNGNYQVPERFSLMMTDELGFKRKNDIIWKKNNILPAGGAAARKVVPDYEHVYYFVKNTKKHYFKQLYEPLSEITLKEYQTHYDSPGNGKDYEGQGIQNPSKVKANIIRRAKRFAPIGGTKYKDNQNIDNNSIYTNNEYKPNLVQGRLLRSVWIFNHDNLPKDILHHSAFPRALIRRLLEMGCKPDGTALDPFLGSGTLGVVANEMQLKWIGIEGNFEYLASINKRLERNQ